MRIGVLTGGGDVPGLNPCIKSLVCNAIDAGHEVIGIRRGWGGILNYNLSLSFEENSANVMKLDKYTVRTIDRTGGTFLHTSRTNPGKTKAKDLPDFLKKTVKPDADVFDMIPHSLKVIETLGIDVLVPIGGDDTLSYGERLHREGIPSVGIPKTMDNDVFGTDYCMGFGSAVQRSVAFVNDLRTCAGSHERIAVIELFGRNSGETSLITGYLASADRVIISEVPFDPERLAQLLLKDRQDNPSKYAIVTVSEGATMTGGKIVEGGEEDAYGHKKLGGIGNILADTLKKLTKQDILYQQISYLMRCGAPSFVDLMVGFNFGNLAVDLINKRIYGQMVAIQNGVYTHIPFSDTAKGVKRVDVDALYDVDAYRPNVRAVKGKPLFLY